MRNLNLAIFILLFLTLAGCNSCDSEAARDSLERIKSEKRIRVGYISYSEITSRDNQTGQLKGFLVDVLYETLADLGIRLAEFWPRFRDS